MVDANRSPPNDLVLIVGPDQVRLSVNAMGLRLSSPFFNTLLGGQFKEARQEEVALPEDNPNALAAIIGFSDFEGMDALPSRSEDAIEIAVLTDKYDFKASRWVLKLWFRECCKSVSFAGLWHYLQAACIVDDAEAANVISARIMMFHAGSFANFEEVHQQVAQDLRILLAERQSVLWGFLLDQFWQHQTAIFAPHGAPGESARLCTCGFLEAYRASCLDKFARLGPGSRIMRGGTLNYDINALSSVEVDDVSPTSCANGLLHLQAKTDLKRRMTDLAWHMKTGGGICIGCLNGKTICRHQHL